MSENIRQIIEQYEDVAITGILAAARTYQPTSCTFEEAVAGLVLELSRNVAQALSDTYLEQQMQQAKESQRAVDDYVQQLLLHGRKVGMYLTMDKEQS